MAGRFIHNVPEDDSTELLGTSPAIRTTLANTVTEILAAGYALDANLWPNTADCSSKCTQCHAGCTNSPTG